MGIDKPFGSLPGSVWAMLCNGDQGPALVLEANEKADCAMVEVVHDMYTKESFLDAAANSATIVGWVVCCSKDLLGGWFVT